MNMNESTQTMKAIELSIEMNIDKFKILSVFHKVNKTPDVSFTINEMTIVERQFFKLINLCQEFPTDWDLKDQLKRFQYVYTKVQAV